MPEQPLVSVITAFYNPGAFLQEAIASVLAQTYANWEYWLVNDGSTDGSAEVAKTAAAAHSDRLHYLEHERAENRGVCTSRNLALQHARGKYVAIIDADDVWLVQKLKEQVEIGTQFPHAGLIFGKSEYWRSWNGGTDDIPDIVPGDRLYQPLELLRLNYPLGPYGAPCPTNLLINCELLRKLGGFEEAFNRHHGMYEDQALLAKLYLSTHVYVSEQVWDRYRIHPDSCCSIAERAGETSVARENYLYWLREYLQSGHIEDRRILKALHRATLPSRHPVLFTFLKLLSGLRRRLRNAC